MSLARRPIRCDPDWTAGGDQPHDDKMAAVMKQIVTIVRPHLAEQVLASLRRAPLEALSVTEVKGYGRQKSYLDEYQETEYAEAFVPKVEITLWVDDSRVDEILEKIVSVARSGRIGDGKILVMPVAEFL